MFRFLELLLMALSCLGAVGFYKWSRRRSVWLRVLGTTMLWLVTIWLVINLAIWLLAHRSIRVPGLWPVYWPLAVLVLLVGAAYAANRYLRHNPDKSGRNIIWAGLAIIALLVLWPAGTGVSNLVSAVAASHVASSNQAAATLSWTKYANESSSAQQACANRVTGTSITDAKSYAFTESQHATQPYELRDIIVVDGKDANPAITTDDEARAAVKAMGVPNVTAHTGVKYFKSIWTYGPKCKRVLVKTPLVTIALGIPTKATGNPELKPSEGVLPSMWPWLKKS